MKQDEIHEARDLLSAHSSLRYRIARDSGRAVSIYSDDSEDRISTHLPANIGDQLLHVALALVEARLYALGVEYERGFDRDCFDCNGTGKAKIE